MGTKPWGQESLTIRLNGGRVVTRPYREAISLVSRRLAEQVSDEETLELETIPLEAVVPVMETPVEEPTLDEPDQEPAAEPQEQVAETVSYEDMKLEDLRDLVRLRGLTVSGNKPDLIDRLVADDADMELVGLSTEATTSGASAEDEPREDSATDDGDD